MKKVGIWIDHRRAVIVTIDHGKENILIMESDVDGKTKPSGRAGAGHPGATQAPVNEHRLEEKYRLHVVHFYKDVIKAIGKPDQLLVMGPAQAKREFADEWEKVGDLRNVPVKIETADKMTDPQVAAKVRATEF